MRCQARASTQAQVARGTYAHRHVCSPVAARVRRGLDLDQNDLTALPEGIFAPLTKLQ